MKKFLTNKLFLLTVIFFSLVLIFVSTGLPPFDFARVFYQGGSIADAIKNTVAPSKVIPPLDKEAYDQKLEEVANNPAPKVVMQTITEKDANGKTIRRQVPLDPQPTALPNLWPVKAVYPNAGAILPFSRIIAYYGNLYSKNMGALGAHPREEMLSRLRAEVKKWNEADPETPAIPALHYITVVAQSSAGEDGKYRARMPGAEIDKVLKMAAEINALVFLDFQVAFSTLPAELPHYEKYLKLPQVHLGIDPEFSMKNGIRPGKVVGTFDAADINFAANYLAGLVRENNLPPKVLVVHRYTQKMVTNYKNIRPLPEVQIVMDMDGWGPQANKISTYKQFIYREPVQFTGFKLFYKNDLWDPGTVLFEPTQLLELSPRPIYIQYQ
ncbi:MAG TPA: hypothetical protein VJB95_01135 [Candidatus Paceibacterota bacterium]